MDDDTTDMVSLARLFARFLHVESCGQCGACKLDSARSAPSSSAWRTEKAATRTSASSARGCRMVTDQSRCYLPTDLQLVVASIMRALPEDFVARLNGDLPTPRLLRLPKIVDLEGGNVGHDERIGLKQPDWTYAPGRRDR